VRVCDFPPKQLDINNEAPSRLPKPLSDQFPVRVRVSPLYCKQSVFMYLYLFYIYTDQERKGGG